MARKVKTTQLSPSSLIGFGSHASPIASGVEVRVSGHAGGPGQQIPHLTVTHPSFTHAQGAKFKFPPNKLQTVITMEPKVFWWNWTLIGACAGLFYRVRKKNLKNSISGGVSIDGMTYSIPSLSKVELQTDF